MTDCILWTKSLNRGGYGSFMRGRKRVMAHRDAWEKVNGPIPAGIYIDHKCRVRNCINVNHLRLVTPRQNALENSNSSCARYVARTACDKGHPFTPSNTGKHQGYRYCRICHRKGGRRYYWENFEKLREYARRYSKHYYIANIERKREYARNRYYASLEEK